MASKQPILERDFSIIIWTLARGRFSGMQIALRTISIKQTRRGGSLISVLSGLLPIALTGCAALKSPAPSFPQPSLASQWHTRYTFSVCVRSPILADFNGVTNHWERQFKMQSASLDANRLAEILSTCRLFESVVVSNIDSSAESLVIEALPNTPPYADPDQVWLMLYAGVIPIYDRVDKSVRFKFMDKGHDAFLFPWTEQTVIGFWAPFVAALGPGWQLAPPLWWKYPRFQGSYWKDLRSALIETMDQHEKDRK
jgi:hypothetical protein